ncbi:MAG: hypothetical protein ABIZ09_12510 [Rhodoferax sp.]
MKTRKVVAWRSFDKQTVACSDDLRAGIVAANHAVEGVVEDLAQFLLQLPQ